MIAGACLLLQLGQVDKAALDAEVRGVVDDRLDADRLTFLEVLLDPALLVVEVLARKGTLLPPTSTSTLKGLRRAALSGRNWTESRDHCATCTTSVIAMEIRVSLHGTRQKKRVAVLLSREQHCLEQLVVDRDSGDLHGDIHAQTRAATRIIRSGPYKEGIAGINRSHFWANYNTSKLGLALNLSTPEGPARIPYYVERAARTSISCRSGVVYLGYVGRTMPNFLPRHRLDAGTFGTFGTMGVERASDCCPANGHARFL